MFIYVMDMKSKEMLEKLGYTFLKDNGNETSAATIWVFANKEEYQFEELDVPCVVSDTLTF